jgi:ABC-2 type transport system ATP-binding protein
MTHRPKLLGLDEPVASLDPMGRRIFMRSLVDTTGNDVKGSDQVPGSILMSSHLLSDLESIVTHVAFMRDGRFSKALSLQESGLP